MTSLPSSSSAREPLMPLPTELCHLNDDCLIELFRYLTPFALASITSTCQRFNDIGHFVFAAKAASLRSFDIVNTAGVEYHSQQRRLKSHVVEYLRQFGASLRQISIRGVIPRRRCSTKAQWSDTIFAEVAVCSGDRLTHLHLDNVVLNTSRLRRFPNLQTLHLYNCMDTDANAAAAASSLFDWDDRRRLGTAHFVGKLAPPDRLQELCITLMDVDEAFLRVLAQYRQLSVLKLNKAHLHGTAERSSWRGLRQLSRLLDVSCVSLDWLLPLVQHLGGRRTLHRFEIDNCAINQRFIEDFGKFRELRVLKLGSTTFSGLTTSHFYEWLDNLQSIAELEFSELSSLNFLHVTDWVTLMPHLLTLTFNQTVYSSCYTPLTAAHFMDLVAVYQQREKKLTVKITDFFAKRFNRVPAHLMNDYRQIVDVTVVA